MSIEKMVFISCAVAVLSYPLAVIFWELIHAII